MKVGSGKMVIGLITLVSALHDLTSIEDSHFEIIDSLKKLYEVKFIEASEADSVDLAIVFVASGGTEEIFTKIYDKLPKPTILLTDGLHNSLAASLEIKTWIKEVGGESEVLHGNIDFIKGRIESLFRYKNILEKIKESTIGVIGFPSSWLIASNVDYIEAKAKWGINYKNIEISNLYEAISKVSYEEAKDIAMSFIKNSSGCIEAKEKDIFEAAKVYIAIRKLFLENKLDACTLKCFDLIEKIKVTGCMALSLLNNEGLISGCEGDCQAIFSMYLVRLLTGETPFMVNPSFIDTESNQGIFAHCTLATSMVSEYTIRSHFESRLSVGIQGKLDKGVITVFKCGGSDLSQYFVSKGTIIDNLDSPNRCRTQAKIQLDGYADYFLNNPIANHHIIIKGEHADLIKDFMSNMSCYRSV